jgi:opacity protein-like surface antigen
MKKTIVLAGLVLSAVTGYAQESRQDASISGFDLITPSVHGNTPVQIKTSNTVGVLGSYRYMLTPKSALEVNYSYAQNTNYYQYAGIQQYLPIHTLQQEFSAAYVYSLNFHRYSPFVEAGPGAMIFSPVKDFGTARQDAKRNTNIGAIFGAGVAYELSPSFDLRAEFRGFFVKAPSFIDDFKTNRYTVIMTPSIGVAYHF